MEDIIVQVKEGMRIYNLPKYLFNKNREVIHRFDIKIGDMNIYVVEESKGIMEERRGHNGFLHNRTTLFLSAYQSDRNFRFKHYQFGYQIIVDGKHVGTDIKTMQEYVSYLIYKNEMPLEIIEDYLNL